MFCIYRPSWAPTSSAITFPELHRKLNFTPEAIAGIFLGKITKWNDPALTQANPGVKLTDAPIVVIHRAGKPAAPPISL